MAAILTLEDGRSIYSSALGMSGMYSLIAKQVQRSNIPFANWLENVSDRPAPFLDFDLRGLENSDRELFYSAAYAAFEELERLHGKDVCTRETAFSARSLARLIEFHKSIKAGEPPESCNDLSSCREYDGKKIDFLEIWE
jgi:hypothetical protein